MLRGDLDEARDYLEQAVEMATKNGNKWYACQSLRTLVRCRIAMGANDEALAVARQALEFAERIGDRQATLESKLLLAESYLQAGDLDSCEDNLQTVVTQVSDSTADMG